MDLNDYKCNYDGIDGISLRDEPYGGEVREIIKQAFGEGYQHVAIDDSFMMFKEEISESEHFDDVEDLLDFAIDEWWQ